MDVSSVELEPTYVVPSRRPRHTRYTSPINTIVVGHGEVAYFHGGKNGDNRLLFLELKVFWFFEPVERTDGGTEERNDHVPPQHVPPNPLSQRLRSHARSSLHLDQPHSPVSCIHPSQD